MYNIFTILNSLPGKGKTEEIIKIIKNNYDTIDSYKGLYVSKTKELSNEIKNRMINSNIKEDDISIIDSNYYMFTKKEFVEEITKFNSNKRILIITGVTLTNLSNIDFSIFNDVCIDEEIQPLECNKLIIEDDDIDLIRCLIKSKISFIPENKDLYSLSLKNSFGKDKISKQIANIDIFKQLRVKNVSLLAFKDDIDRFLDESTNTFTYYTLSDVIHSTNSGYTYLLGFDIEHTEMGLVYTKIHGSTFNDATPLSHTSYRNNIFIHYCSEIDIGNTKLSSDSSIRDSILDAYKNYLDEDTLVCDFNYPNAPKSDFTKLHLPKVPHGLNKDVWMDKTKIALFSHFRHSPEELRFYEVFDINKKELDRAREGNMFVQISARAKHRSRNSTDDIHIFVIDKRSAKIMEECLSGCNVTLVYDKMPKSLKKRSNQTKITTKEKRRMEYLRNKKKNNPSKFTKENQEELSRLVLKMNTK